MFNFSSFSIADLYAIKSEAKEKEAYYRSVKGINKEFADAHTYWANMLAASDKELVTRLTNLPQD